MTEPTSSAESLETYWPFVDPFERARFPPSVYVPSGDECWIWPGGVESDGGYGRFRARPSARSRRIGGRRSRSYGALSEAVVRHRCDVRCCVGSDHLVVGPKRRTSPTPFDAAAGRAMHVPARGSGQRLPTRCGPPPGRATTSRSPNSFVARFSSHYGPNRVVIQRADACSPVAVAVSS